MRRSPLALSLVLLALAMPAVAAQPTVPVTTCGQAVPPNTTGVLSADLDCTGFTGGAFGVAVTLDKSANLDLGGFTLTGGQFGFGCATPHPDGFSTSKCGIRNGTIENAVNSGVIGDKIKIENVCSAER